MLQVSVLRALGAEIVRTPTSAAWNSSGESYHCSLISCSLYFHSHVSISQNPMLEWHGDLRTRYPIHTSSIRCVPPAEYTRRDEIPLSLPSSTATPAIPWPTTMEPPRRSLTSVRGSWTWWWLGLAQEVRLLALGASSRRVCQACRYSVTWASHSFLNFDERAHARLSPWIRLVQFLLSQRS